MIELLYRGEHGRKKRSFRSLGAARSWCYILLGRPLQVVEAFGYVADQEGNHVVPLRGCTIEELAT